MQASQLNRWFVPEPFEIVCIPIPFNDPNDPVAGALSPLIAVDFGHAVWLEYTEQRGSNKRLRFATFPAVGVDRASPDFDSSFGHVTTLDTPSWCNLDTVCHIGIDQAQGCVILGLDSGQIYILNYQ